MKTSYKCNSKTLNLENRSIIENQDGSLIMENNIISIIQKFSDFEINEKNITEFEEIIIKFIKCVLEFPFLVDFIAELVDIDKIIVLIDSYEISAIIHFLALFIQCINIRNAIFPIYDKIIQNYFGVKEIQKDYIRLLFINLSTCEIKNDEYTKIISLIKVINSHEILKGKEILDILTIIEILTSTIFLIPEDFLEIFRKIFYQVFFWLY